MKPRIDVKRTGMHLRRIISEAGYTVAEIQNYLGLSCPQPVYRWYKGQTLPCIDHLVALGVLLDKHVEELMVIEEDMASSEIKPSVRERLWTTNTIRRLKAYHVGVRPFGPEVPKSHRFIQT